MKIWIPILVVLGVMTAIIYMTMSIGANEVECEACVEFGGRAHCGRVSGPTRVEAEIGALMNACSSVAHGVTETLACQRTVPHSLSCTL